jgi:hypothetical protein
MIGRHDMTELDEMITWGLRAQSDGLTGRHVIGSPEPVPLSPEEERRVTRVNATREERDDG